MTNEQVQEVWTGTTFGVAALMLSDGLKDEAYRTAWGVSYDLRDPGLLVPNPGSRGNRRHYRASLHMRPAAIWALEMTAPPE
jgi:non-lysosomal glucosylceramidase